MPSPSPEAVALGERYRLALRHRVRAGTLGERLGQGTGSSTEFHDSRAYQVGDDVRHVDWRALARTGQVLVRQYREETLPRLDLLLDTSRSMRVEVGKAQLALDLTAVLVGAARGEGFSVSLLLLGDEPRLIEGAAVLADPVSFEGRRPLGETLREASGQLRSGSLRIVVSDFLDPLGPDAITQLVGRSAGGWALLQVLGVVDANPPPGVARRLIDVEREEALELEIEADLRERYLARLRRLVDGLRESSHARGGTHIELLADRSAEQHCRQLLVNEGVLIPA